MADLPICSKTVLSNCCPSTRFQHRTDELTYLLKDSPVKHLPIYTFSTNNDGLTYLLEDSPVKHLPVHTYPTKE